LQNIISGKPYYSHELMGYLSGRSKTGNRSSHITKREEQILQLVGKGLKNQQIADHYNVSLRTITNHRANMHKKFGVNNTVQLISWGLKNKILNRI
jgi:DNA-binding NarL/FixJ family response regulator